MFLYNYLTWQTNRVDPTILRQSSNHLFLICFDHVLNSRETSANVVVV